MPMMTAMVGHRFDELTADLFKRAVAVLDGVMKAPSLPAVAQARDTTQARAAAGALTLGMRAHGPQDSGFGVDEVQDVVMVGGPALAPRTLAWAQDTLTLCALAVPIPTAC